MDTSLPPPVDYRGGEGTPRPNGTAHRQVEQETDMVKRALFSQKARKAPGPDRDPSHPRTAAPLWATCGWGFCCVPGLFFACIAIFFLHLVYVFLFVGFFFSLFFFAVFFSSGVYFRVGFLFFEFFFGVFLMYFFFVLFFIGVFVLRCSFLHSLHNSIINLRASSSEPRSFAILIASVPWVFTRLFTWCPLDISQRQVLILPHSTEISDLGILEWRY